MIGNHISVLTSETVALYTVIDKSMELIDLEDRIRAFSLLGKHVEQLLVTERGNTESNKVQKEISTELLEICQNAYNQNTWFTKESVIHAFKGLLQYLQEENLRKWLANYDLANQSPKIIGTVMAGNIPMVGIHDFISILISGNKIKVKLSTLDQFLMKYIAAQLVVAEKRFENYIDFAELLKGVDALIATGSDNTARYLEYYFRKVPRIIRKNRTSCAILRGGETIEDLKNLSKDIFLYFGLGCRNVSKVFVPENYSFENLLHALEIDGEKAVQNHKYVNNYDYNKSIFLINKVPHLDNGYILLKEDDSLFSPISVLHFEYYSNVKELENQLLQEKDNIQCIVSKGGYFKNSIAFGKAQLPQITDYTDGIDTLGFLQKIS
ncbi:MAG: acyl-CoA reductase [Bacteroidota bacterium]